MLFSVVIPTFNRLAYLPRTLASVRAQTCADFETIVVDDGSTDGTRDYLSSLGSEVTVVHQSNRGPGAARNAGVRVAKGDYAAFLDSDDIWLPWTLATFARVIDEAAPEFLVADYVHFSDDASVTAIQETALQYRRFDDFISASEHPLSAGAGSMVVSRARFVASGGFTSLPINCEDHDLSLRLGEAPGFAHVASPVTLGYRRHGDGMTDVADKTVAGMAYLIAQERSGQYPGGERRAAARREIVTRQVRPVMVACSKAGNLNAAIGLYRATAAWHVQQGRWRFLLGLPAIAAMAALKNGAQRSPPRMA